MQKFLAPALGLCLAFAAAAPAAEHTKDTPETVRKALAEKKAVLIDVREQSEWDEGHLRDARLLPLSTLTGKVDEKAVAKAVDKDKIVYIHCRSGRRCLTAAEVLGKLGYKVRPLKPGYEDLLKAGFPKAEK